MRPIRLRPVLLAALILLAPRQVWSMAQMSMLVEAHRLLEGQDTGRARELLDAYVKEHPGDAAANYFLAEAAFHEGDYGRARSFLERFTFEHFPWADRDFPQLVADTAAAVGAMTAHRGEHFTLFLDEGRDWVLKDPAFKTLESAYRSLGPLFGTYPREPVRVEIYPDAESFQKASSLTRQEIENSGAIAICRFNKIMVLSPRALLRGYRWMDTLTHEYVHHLLIGLTVNQAPIWVQEGVAKYFEKRWKPDGADGLWPGGASLLAEALETGAFIPFDAMDPSLVRLQSVKEVSLAFAECTTAVAFILSKAGEPGLLDFLADIRRRGTAGTRQALADVIRMDFGQFEAAWKQYLAGLGLARLKNQRFDRFVLAAAGEDEAALYREIQSQAAANYLRLGDSLRREGRLKPSLIEYKRAYREAPDFPYIINKVAIAALLLGDHATAREYLEKALEVTTEFPMTYKIFGDANLEEGLAAEALRNYDEYNQLNPYNPQVWRMRGLAFRRLGRTDEALAAWETSLRLNPADERLRRDLEDVRQGKTQTDN